MSFNSSALRLAGTLICLAFVPVIANAVPDTNVDYFGYYHLNSYWNERDDGYFAHSQENIIEVGELSCCNTGVLEDYGAFLADDLDLAFENQLHCWVSVFNTFFHYTGGGGFGDGSAFLLSDWEARWSDFKSRIAGREEKIMGFYFDEPFWNGVTETDFLLVTNRIRQDFPGKKILTVESVISLEPWNFWYPDKPAIPDDYLSECTDAGYDYYFGQWREPAGVHSYYRLFQVLRNKAGQDQDLWVIPGVSYVPSGGQDAATARENILRWYKMAIDDYRVIGMLLFTYASFPSWISPDQSFDSQNPLYAPSLKNININTGMNIYLNGTGDLFAASLDFSSEQMYENWQYTDNVNYYMYWADGYWKSYSSPYCYIIDGEVGAAPEAEVVRRWIAPKDGRIRVDSIGNFKKVWWSLCGDGVTMAIYHYNGDMTKIWPEGPGWQFIDSDDTTGVNVQIDGFPVAENDQLLFIMDSFSNGYCDRAFMDVAVSYDKVPVIRHKRLAPIKGIGKNQENWGKRK